MKKTIQELVKNKQANSFIKKPKRQGKNCQIFQETNTSEN